MQILTWNIQEGRSCDEGRDVPRIAREAKQMADFDVLCLQEVSVNFRGPDESQDQVALLREALDGYECLFGIAIDLPRPAGGRSLFGNMMFSRLPVLQVFRHLLPWPPDPDVPSMQRMCLEAVVEAPFGALRIMTTHLEYFSHKQRMAQIEELRRLHAEACARAASPPKAPEPARVFAALARPTAAVLCGDMNFKPSAVERELMTTAITDAPGFRDAWEVVHGDLPHVHTLGVHNGNGKGTYCSDYMFVTEDLAPRVAAIEVNLETPASDHQPVILTLRD